MVPIPLRTLRLCDSALKLALSPPLNGHPEAPSLSIPSLLHFPLHDLLVLHDLNIFVYLVYFVVQIFASFAFFAANNLHGYHSPPQPPLFILPISLSTIHRYQIPCQKCQPSASHRVFVGELIEGLESPYHFVYSVYSVVQIFASFAFFAATNLPGYQSSPQPPLFILPISRSTIHRYQNPCQKCQPSAPHRVFVDELVEGLESPYHFVYSVYSRLLGAPLRGSRSLGFLDFVSLSGSNLCALCVLCG